MVAVTILGAGITGMTIATQLPRDYKITIVAKHFPGDPEDMNYASNWAGACWVGVPESSPHDRKLQLDAYAGLWQTAKDHPEAGLRISKVTEIMEEGSRDAIWFRNIPGFRFLSKHELPPKASWGMTYTSVIISPPVFTKWLRIRLEAQGVKFLRRTVDSLDDLKDMGHDVLINATGAGSKSLGGVVDKTIIPCRLQSLVVEKNWNEGFIYRGKDGYYFNMFGRPDGTCYIGGFKDFHSDDRTVYGEQRQTILTRGHTVIPNVLPSDQPKDYKILYDIATSYSLRPQKYGGTRVEKEMVNGQKVIHAYGQEAGGFTYSFGVARAASQLVSDYLYELPLASRL